MSTDLLNKGLDDMVSGGLCKHKKDSVPWEQNFWVNIATIDNSWLFGKIAYGGIYPLGYLALWSAVVKISNAN